MDVELNGWTDIISIRSPSLQGLPTIDKVKGSLMDSSYPRGTVTMGYLLGLEFKEEIASGSTKIPYRPGSSNDVLNHELNSLGWGGEPNRHADIILQ
jgi:hypothetical protein